MILAEKITELRKKNGWSQEELANQINVSRQSVSKWESAQSVPDLDKILQLGQIFGVSTDYLLKDEMEAAEYTAGKEESMSEPPLRRVSMEEANEFLAVKSRTARPIALATSLCILSPVCLILLGEASEMGRLAATETVASGIGLIVLLLMVASAVAVFISCGMKTKPFEYLDSEVIETEYGVLGMVRERKSQYKDSYTRNVVIGTCLCILAAIPLFVGDMFAVDDMHETAGLACTIVLVAVGVYFFVMTGIYWSALERLMQEGDFTKERKMSSKPRNAVAAVYWLLAVAAYLGYSFATDNWEKSWIIWPVAGVLFAAVITVFDAVYKSK